MTFLEFIKNLNIYYLSTAKGLGKPYDIGTYEGEDIKAILDKITSTPDPILIESLELVKTHVRMQKVLKLTPKDYYSAYDNNINARTKMINDVADKFIRASHI